MYRKCKIGLMVVGIGTALSAVGSASATGSTSGVSGGRPHFEAASALVPAGSSCLLHPEGNSDPTRSIPVRADADGVARFQAVRPVFAGSVGRLTLDCTDSDGHRDTFSIDLASDETFERRPFEASRTNLKLRPALMGDPLGFTQAELIQAGYGLRPDPTANPDGYERWLTAVSVPAYKLRTAARTSSILASGRPLPSGVDPLGTSDSDGTVTPVPSGRNYAGWTGAVLNGSYQKNATSAETRSYLMNEASFVVPTVYPGGLGTGSTQMSIWNGLDTSSSSLFQTIVWVATTPTAQSFWIHRQDFASADPASAFDGEGADFTPRSGDLIYSQVWYCDAKGNENLSGGYACSLMIDVTQNVEWECDQRDGAECQSFAIKASELKNGQLGQTAEFIIEGDTDEVFGNCPSSSKTSCYDEWPDFSPVTMYGSALVVKGSGTSGSGTVQTVATDPSVTLRTDDVTSIPFERGDGHLLITLLPGPGALPPGSAAVKWSEQQTNVYYWNGSNFNSLSTPQESPPAQPAVIFGCASSIGVGPNSRGLTNGTPWITGCHPKADGNSDVYEMQTGGKWVEMQSDVATQIAVSPEGKPWAINAKGEILFWNGSKFVLNPTGGCATSISVGPNSHGLTNGTPWITGCHAGSSGSYDVYQMQNGGNWVKIQDDIANQISVSPEGSFVFALGSQGILASYEGGPFNVISIGVVFPGSSVPVCATSIVAGPSLTPWIVGCLGLDSAPIDGNFPIYQLNLNGTLQLMQADGGTQIAMSPAGQAWMLSSLR